ncbi:hypothetical protein [Nocardioides panzhihuensis]|uniref:Putative membrane protein n=1 Tax=Nocardioides panzhihuensis TaxID=860243 RepID=A0A7Z0DKQ8_9ACTN|nr:hypothetical protein [Nocardioides panzhihuensis]NYI77056.1 putative membrane protein [Nocardioides panzhihuensis]
MASIRRRAKKSDIDRQLSNWSKRRIASWSLFGLAAVVAIQHLVAHAGWHPIPMSMGWQDVLIGYPMAIGLGIIGGIVMDPNPRV